MKAKVTVTEKSTLLNPSVNTSKIEFLLEGTASAEVATILKKTDSVATASFFKPSRTGYTVLQGDSSTKSSVKPGVSYQGSKLG